MSPKTYRIAISLSYAQSQETVELEARLRHALPAANRNGAIVITRATVVIDPVSHPDVVLGILTEIGLGVKEVRWINISDNSPAL